MKTFLICLAVLLIVGDFTGVIDLDVLKIIYCLALLSPVALFYSGVCGETENVKYRKLQEKMKNDKS